MFGYPPPDVQFSSVALTLGVGALAQLGVRAEALDICWSSAPLTVQIRLALRREEEYL